MNKRVLFGTILSMLFVCFISNASVGAAASHTKKSNPKPAITISCPKNNERFSVGFPLFFGAEVTNNNNVEKMQMFIDGKLLVADNNILAGPVTAHRLVNGVVVRSKNTVIAPSIGYKLDTDKMSLGRHVLTVKAYDGRNVGTKTVAFELYDLWEAVDSPLANKSPEEDSEPPVIIIHSPANDSRFVRGESVRFSASATDDVRVVGMGILIDDVPFLREFRNKSGIATKLNTKGFKIGRHVITVKAVDSKGNASTEKVDFEIY